MDTAAPTYGWDDLVGEVRVRGLPRVEGRRAAQDGELPTLSLLRQGAHSGGAGAVRPGVLSRILIDIALHRARKDLIQRLVDRGVVEGNNHEVR